MTTATAPRLRRPCLRHVLSIAVVSLLTMSATRATAQDKEIDAKIAELTKALKDKQPAVRMKAAEGLADLGTKAKAATPDLIAALYDPAQPVRVTALDALKKVNPTLHGPIAALMEPFAPAAVNINGSALAKLARLRSDAKPALPVVLNYFQVVSRSVADGAFLSRAHGEAHLVSVLEVMASIAVDDPTVKQIMVTTVVRGQDNRGRTVAVKALVAAKDAKMTVPVLARVVQAD